MENLPLCNNLIKAANIDIETIELVKFLLENKADINNLLIEATRWNKLKLVKFLLENKADVTCEDNQPLINCFYFYESFSLDIVNLLVSSNADITCRDNEPLMMASLRKDAKIVEYLIENKADVKTRDSRCLDNAACSGSSQVMELLIKNGADILGRKYDCISRAGYWGNNEILYYLDCKGLYKPKKIIPNEPNQMTLNYLVYKIFRIWRKIVFKSFFRRVVTPLYYSPGFPGYIEGKKELLEI